MRCYVRFWSLTVPAILLTLPALTTRQVEAGFVLGPAVTYGVLVEGGNHNIQLNNSTISGNVGIGGGLTGGVQIASNGFIIPIPGEPGTGRLDLVDTVVTVDNPGNVAGGVHFNQPQVTTAINFVNSLSSTLSLESGTALTISGGGQIVNASSGTLDGSGNRVFSIASNGFKNDNQGFRINGTASDFVVLNINNGTSNEDLGGPISLIGGIIPDHVLFNFFGTGGNLGASTGGATVSGIILAPNMLINTDNTTVIGRIYGGGINRDFSVVSGMDVLQPTAAVVPEPGSLVLLALGGLGGVLLSSRLPGGGRRRAA